MDRHQVLAPANVDMEDVVHNPFLLNLLQVNDPHVLSDMGESEDSDNDETIDEGVTYMVSSYYLAISFSTNRDHFLR